jgi:hypothetical protein
VIDIENEIDLSCIGGQVFFCAGKKKAVEAIDGF